MVGRPRAQLAAARARGEVGIGLRVVDDFDLALDPHLHAQHHARPVEQQRGVRIGLQLAALAAVEVRVEDEAARVVRLQQHGARGGAALRIGGRDDHGGGVGFARRRGLREQVVEGSQDFRRDRSWQEVGAHGCILAH